MSKAKVSLSAVTTFRKNADNEKVVADALNATLGSIDKCVAEILKERQKIDVAMTKTSKAIISVGNKISIIKNQIAKLEDKIAILRSKLAATKPTITVTHTEEVGTDEEGNPIYSSYTTEEPNPEYIAIENEIASVESELSEKRAKLAKAESIKAKLEATKAGMQKMIETLDTSKKELLTAKTSLQAKINQISKCSASATSSLSKAEKAIQKYLNEKVRNIASLQIANIIFPSSLSTRKETSTIYDTDNPDYWYYSAARNAIQNINNYYSQEKTVKHLHASAHFRGVKADERAKKLLSPDELRNRQGCIDATKALERNGYNPSGINMKELKSYFKKDIDEERVKDLVLLALYNCDKAAHKRPFKMICKNGREVKYDLKFVYESDLGTVIGIDRLGKKTSKVKIVIGENLANNDDSYMISVYPFL